MEKKNFATNQHLQQMLHQLWCNKRAGIWAWVCLALPGAIIFSVSIVVSKAIMAEDNITCGDALMLAACLMAPRLFSAIWKRCIRNGSDEMVIRISVHRDESGNSTVAVQIGEAEIAFAMPTSMMCIAMFVGVWFFPKPIVASVVVCILVVMIASYIIVGFVALTFGIAEIILQIRDLFNRRKL